MSNGAKFWTVIFLSIGLAASVARAQEPVDKTPRSPATEPVDHVLELFTSQGCVSCPPADKILTKLSDLPGVLALAYHVDYWDYIGWRDTFASPANTERQRDYARSFSTSTIYTPQLVVNGRTDMVGSRETAIRSAMKRLTLRATKGNARVSMRLVGDRVHIDATVEGMEPGQPMPILVLVVYADEARTAIGSGENKGKTLTTTHPVRDWRVLGMWQGKPMEVDMPAEMLKRHMESKDKNEKGGGCAALLQAIQDDGSLGPILAAARMDFHGTPSNP